MRYEWLADIGHVDVETHPSHIYYTLQEKYEFGSDGQYPRRYSQLSTVHTHTRRSTMMQRRPYSSLHQTKGPFAGACRGL